MLIFGSQLKEGDSVTYYVGADLIKKIFKVILVDDTLYFVEKEIRTAYSIAEDALYEVNNYLENRSK